MALDEASKSRVEAQAIVDNSQESEGKEDASDDVSRGEVAKAGYSYAYTAEHG